MPLEASWFRFASATARDAPALPGSAATATAESHAGPPSDPRLRAAAPEATRR